MVPEDDDRDPDNPELEVNPSDEIDEGGGQPSPRRYGGGKYASLPEFEAGYSQSFAEVERLRSSEQAAQARAAALETFLIQQAQRQPSREEPGFVPVDPEQGLSRAQLKEALVPTVRELLSEALDPLVQGANARAQMLRTYPEFGQEEIAIQQHLASNPRMLETYNRIAAADPYAANEFAFAQYRLNKPAPTPNGSRVIDARERTNASLPKGATGAARQDAKKGGFDMEVYQDLIKEGRESGDYTKAIDYRLRGVVPESHFRGGWSR
jgi:hypothetical protein